MANEFRLPEKKAFVFWPVGTGDSTTLIIDPGAVVMQIDLRHLEKADNPEEPEWPIIDHLVRVLPRRNGKPYLALFVLTHPDKDHVLGFKELLKRVTIGELWHTPRIFTEYKTDLCEDALAFRSEAERRRNITIRYGEVVGSGDRVRVIGHDDIFEEDEYRDFPDKRRSVPGTTVSEVDGTDYAGVFEAFIHAPFKDDIADTRNNTSLALQITLTEGIGNGKALFFGDRDYTKIKRIFDKTKEKHREQYLEWNVMLSSHHCSKSVMYFKDEGEDEEKFRQDIMDGFSEARLEGAFLIASSHSDFSDEEGKNPPHLKARRRYEEIVDAGHFVCTHEHPNKKQPVPIVFIVDEQGFRYVKPGGEASDSRNSVALAVAAARGGSAPPKEQVGFGCRP